MAVFKKRPVLYTGLLSVATLLVIGALSFALTRQTDSAASIEVSKSGSARTAKTSSRENVVTIDSKDTATEQTSSNHSPDPSASASSSSKPAPISTPASGKVSSSPAAPQSYGTVAPNPYCPAPTFTINVTRQSSSNYNLFVTPISDPSDPSLTPACGGGINFSTPKVGYPASGPFCSGLTYPIGNNNWGVACSIYGNTAYGDYTFTFTITGTNGFNKSTTHLASYTYHYIQE